jgi:hypothetical protein
MHRIATVQVLLAILGIVFLLANPAGICAGTAAVGASHPCCPKPSGDAVKSPCVCIDRQPASPTLPSIGDSTQADVIAPVLEATAEISITASAFAFEDPAPRAPQTIILSIHQLLL